MPFEELRFRLIIVWSELHNLIIMLVLSPNGFIIVDALFIGYLINQILYSAIIFKFILELTRCRFLLVFGVYTKILMYKSLVFHI